MKNTLASVITAAFLVVAALAADGDVIRKAPELAFAVPGQGQRLLSQYRGKVVALEFIFTTCPHCRAASQVMKKYQQEFAARGFQAIDVAVNENADLMVDNFTKETQVNFPVGWTPRDQMLSFMGFTSGRFVVPQLVLIDRKGNVRYQTPALEDENWEKLMDEQKIHQHIEELLSQGSGSAHVPARSGVAKKSS